MGRAGAAGAMGIWREGGRVLADGHFSARTSAALPTPPYNWQRHPHLGSVLRMEIPDQVGDDGKGSGMTEI